MGEETASGSLHSSSVSRGAGSLGVGREDRGLAVLNLAAQINPGLDTERAGRSFTAMDAKIATEEGTFTAENAESAGVCTE